MADSPVDTALAEAFRDWIHESPLSLCGYGSDECPDWPMAYELARIAASVPARSPDALVDALHEAIELAESCFHDSSEFSPEEIYETTDRLRAIAGPLARSAGDGGEQG